MESQGKANHQDSILEAIENNKKKIPEFLERMPEQFKAWNDFSMSYMDLAHKIMANPESLRKSQNSFLSYWENQLELSRRILERQKGGEYVPVIEPEPGDKRFKAEEWNEYPYGFDYIKQNYLLISQLVNEIIESAELDKKAKAKLGFFSRQYMDALSPSNFFLTNPEAIKLAQQSNGKSLVHGFENLMSDLKKGRISQTDENAFQVGQNLATTKGSVIYENELMQLIQYAPETTHVSEFPLLMIPPWINKYYILDLHADRSLAEYAIKQGHTTFMISWKNPTPDMGYLTFDDYVVKGALKAIEVSRAVTGAKKIDTLGYCLGGTLLGVTLAILRSDKPTFMEAEREKNSINSVTFLATMLDFSDVGDMGAIIDEPLVTHLENELKGGGVLKGEDMAKAFNTIRANELVWHYVTNNYLKGQNPPPFSVLYWTCDNTNLPARMYTFYLRHMLFENKLSKKNALKICRMPIDLSKIDIPAYVIGTIDDHIAPCRTAFTTTELLGGETEYILGDSGHIMGAINPPSQKNKYHHHVNGVQGKGFDYWEKTASKREGSWWPDWNTWLSKRGGKQIPAPAVQGNKNFPPLEAAPGRYVKERN
jgi:polyhydroxyalkanoate synthase